MSKIVLGKGLQALIPGEETEHVDDRQVRHIELDRLKPNPFQPRRQFDQDQLSDLAASLRRNGVMQPLLVRQDGSTFTIIAGERRFRAARLAGLEQVPALVLEDVDDARMLELALVENLQREDLNPLETAEAYRTLLEKCGLTQSQLAGRVGKSRVAVTNRLRLLSLPDSIKDMIRSNRLTEGHARAVLSLENEAEMIGFAERIINDALTVREAERQSAPKKKRRLMPKRKSPALAEAENNLRRIMGTSVKIIPGLKRGRIEVEYYNDDDLDRLLELFARMEQ